MTICTKKNIQVMKYEKITFDAGIDWRAFGVHK